MKKRYVFLSAFAFLIAFFLISTWEQFFGNETKATEGAKQYLEEKFGKEFVVENYIYEFGAGEARMEAYPVGHPEERFEMVHGGNEAYYENYTLAQLVIPYLQPLTGMPVLYHYETPDLYQGTVEEYINDKRYDKLSFSVNFFITERNQEEAVIKKILDIKQMVSNQLGIESFYFNIRIPKTSKVEIENKGLAIEDYEEFGRHIESRFKIYCSAEALGPYKACE
ncbi:hypothetical protein [Bacillus sp. E(2018)]|uniref:hypothetical protein n=1 Tax=Bacillus sp. E(2018) TaxID=2502239 RepID=UPI0010F8526E|nr:hypothetical protein [Bacillus sp. E(2018)]